MKLSDRFRASGGAPIVLDGSIVHMFHEITGDASTTLSIEFARQTATRAQALRLKAASGLVEVNGEAMADVVLWAATAPESTIVQFRPIGTTGHMTLRLWNAWRDPAGTMQAWIGNSGLIVEAAGGSDLILRCSDGYGAPSFDDLVATVRVVS